MCIFQENDMNTSLNCEKTKKQKNFKNYPEVTKFNKEMENAGHSQYI